VENHRQQSSNRLDEDRRNILRRSTIDSDRNFWTGERPVTVVQAIGLLLILFGLVVVMGHWPKGEAPWWEKLISGNAAFLMVFGCLVLFVLLGNRWARRKTRGPDKR
jgi:drug/metabolite transporter (DMT)-like permease